MPRPAASVAFLQRGLAASAHRDLPGHLGSFDDGLGQRPAGGGGRRWQRFQHIKCLQAAATNQRSGCRHEPEAGVSLFLLGQNELRRRLARRESEGAEGGLRVADPLQVLPEDLHHLGAHLLVKSHLYQLEGDTALMMWTPWEVIELIGADMLSSVFRGRAVTKQTCCYHI